MASLADCFKTAGFSSKEIDILTKRLGQTKRGKNVTEESAFRDLIPTLEQELLNDLNSIRTQLNIPDAGTTTTTDQPTVVQETVPATESTTSGLQVLEDSQPKTDGTEQVSQVKPDVATEPQTIAEIETRMSQLEDQIDNTLPAQRNDPAYKALQSEFNALEKRAEEIERASVFEVPLSEVNSALDALVKKEKEKPNGFGAFIEKRDVRESKEVVKKYSSPDTITDKEIKNDYKNALLGNPDTWYADGLKLREAGNLAAERNIDIAEILAEVEKEFVAGGFTSKEAKDVIAHKLASVYKGSTVVEPTTKTLAIEAPQAPNETAQTTSTTESTEVPKTEKEAVKPSNEPKTEKKGAGQYIKRIFASPKVSEETKAILREEIDVDKKKEPVTNVQAQKVVNEIIALNGKDIPGLLATFAELQAFDPKIWFRDEGIGLMLGAKIAYELEKAGDFQNAARVDAFMGDQTTRTARELARLKENATPEQRVASLSKSVRQKIIKGKARKIGNTTVGEKIDKIAEAMLPSEKAVAAALKAAGVAAETKETAAERIKEGKALVKEGFLDLRKAGLASGPIILSREGAAALTKIIKGLYKQFSGNITKIREAFREELKDTEINADEAWNELNKQGVIETIKKEQAKDIEAIINDHIKNPKTNTDFRKALRDAGVNAGLASRVAKALHEQIVAELKSKLPDIEKHLAGGRGMEKKSVRNKKLDDILNAAANGFLSNRDMTSILSKAFGLGDLSIEQQLRLNDLIEKLNNTNSNRQKIKAETNLLTEIAKLDTGSQKQVIEFILAMYYTNILSGLSTQSVAFFGAFFNIAGEVGAEVIRGVVEGRTKTTLNAFRKGFSKQGIGAGVGIVGDILKSGTIDLSFADVSSKSLTGIDRLVNSKFRFDKNLVPRELGRALFILPTVMYRLLIAADAVMKSGLTESFAHIAAYNKVLNEEGNLYVKGSPEFYNRMNEILGETNLDELKDIVATEIAEGKIEPKEVNTRLRELIEEGRDQEITKNANERALEVILMNSEVSGYGTSLAAEFLGGAMRINERDSLPLKLVKLMIKTFFPIVRISANQLARAYQFTPFVLIERGILDKMPGKVGELGRNRRKFDIRTGKPRNEEISVEERKRQLYRGALGSVAMLALYGLLGLQDDDKDPLIRITGGGTGDFKKDQQQWGKEWKQHVIQINLKKLGLETSGEAHYSSGIRYGDTPMMLAMSPFGHIMDQRAIGTTQKELEIVNLMGAGLQAAYNGSFDLGFVFASDFMEGVSSGFKIVTEKNPTAWDKLKGFGRLAAVTAGSAKIENYNEYIVAKQFERRVEPFVVANIYKQGNLIYKDLIDKPLEDAENTLDLLMRSIPFAASLVNKATTDKFGYPIQPDFDTPIIPDFVENWVDNRVGAGESKMPEWEALRGKSFGAGKNFTLPSDYTGSDIEGIDNVTKDKLQSSYQSAFRRIFNENLKTIGELSGEELNTFIDQKVHDKARERAQKEVLNGTDKLAKRVQRIQPKK